MEKKKNTSLTEQFQSQISKALKEPKSIPVTRKYTTAHFPWYSHFNQKTCNT